MPTEHTWTPVENIRLSVHVWAYSEINFHILRYNKLCMCQEGKQHTYYNLHCSLLERSACKRNRQLANVGYIAIKPVDLVWALQTAAFLTLLLSQLAIQDIWFWGKNKTLGLDSVGLGFYTVRFRAWLYILRSQLTHCRFVKKYNVIEQLRNIACLNARQ